MYDALYTRQSVEKVDSISIESQLEYCKYETRGNLYKEYIDRGYSGKNTNRPAFEELLEDIKQGKISRVINPYRACNACYLYKGIVSTTRKQCDLTDKEIVLASHEGIVSSQDWIKCRIRCLSNRQSTKTCKFKNSWLVGKVKCGKCGYGLTIAKANTKWHRYFICATAL